MNRKSLILAVCMSVIFLGCMHGRGTHNIPVSRDYKALEKTSVRDATERVKEAHRLGTHLFAPYEYQSAAHYRDWAQMEWEESDLKGAWDYSTLASRYAAEAKAKGSGIPDKGAMPMPRNHEACMAEYDRLAARYRELDACMAKLVAPVVYAHIEANLSIAEHELMEWGHYEQAARFLACVEADIDAIWAKDTDGDGVIDMKDGDPWIAEDKDGFQDEDGIPEPKPYPVLTAVYFASDSAKLSGESAGYLRGIAKMLDNGYRETTVYVEGHTDSDSSETYNMDLSKRRTQAVRECLVKNGAQDVRISEGSRGESKPVADNKTEKGKALNRRVEIWLDSSDVVSPYCR